MSIFDRQSIVNISSSINLENKQKKEKPELLAKLKPLVEQMTIDEIAIKQSEAENNLQKYIVFQKKNEKLEIAVKNIKDKNE